MRLRVVKYIVAVLRPELFVVAVAPPNLKEAIEELERAREIYPDAVLYEQLEFSAKGEQGNE